MKIFTFVIKAMLLMSVTASMLTIITTHNQNQGLFAKAQNITTPNPKSITIPIDLYLLIDASGSISQYASRVACKESTKNIYPPEGKNCWELFNIFANSLFDIVRELAGGYALTGDDGGIRLSLYTFSCRSGDPITKSILIGPTGNPASIAKGFETLAKVVPADGTCPSEGLKYIRKEIEKTISLSQQRISGVVLITDGMIDSENFERTKARAEASTIVGLPGTNFFAISVANDPSSQAQQTQQLLGLVGGDESKLFPIENQGSLPTIQGILAAALGNDFFAKLDLKDKVDEALPYGGNGIDQVCSGATTSVILTGRSVQYLSRNTIACSFSRPDIPSSILSGERTATTISTFDPITKARICELPGSFMSNLGDVINLQLKVLDGTQYRLVGKLLSLNLKMIGCAERSNNLIDSGSRCLIGGGNTIVSFSGPTIKYARSRLTAIQTKTSLPQYKPICIFTQSGIKITSPAIISSNKQDEIICSLDPNEAIDKILASGAIIAPVDTVSIGVGSLAWESNKDEIDTDNLMPIGLITTNSIEFEEDEKYPNSISNGCFSFNGLSTSEACWTGLTDPIKGPFVYLSGKSVNTLASKKDLYLESGFSLSCSFYREDQGDSSNLLFSEGYLVDKNENGQEIHVVQCVIPAQILQTNDGSGVTRSFVVGLYAKSKYVDHDDNSNAELVLLTNNMATGFKASIKVKSCFVISYVSRKCVGEDHQFSVLGEGISAYSTEGIICRFFDTENDVIVNIDAIINSQSSITCKEPASVGEYLGLLFDSLYLIDKATSNIFFNVDGSENFGLDLCLNFSVKNMPKDNTFCWGSLYGNDIQQYPNDGAKFSIIGPSTRILSTSDKDIKFGFYDSTTKQEIDIMDTQFTNSLTQNDGSGEYISYIPNDIAKLSTGNKKIIAKLFVGSRIQASFEFDIKINGCAKIQEVYKPSISNESPTLGTESCWPYCCMRDSINIEINGESIDDILESEDSSCLFYSSNDGGSSLSQVIASSKLIKVDGKSANCVAPGWSPFSSKNNGIYSKVSISVSVPTGNGNTKKTFEVASSNLITPTKICSAASYQNSAIWGEPIIISLKGTSLFALDKWRSDSSLAWGDFLRCSLIDIDTGKYDKQSLDVTWNRDSGILSCKRPGTFSSYELKSTSIRVSIDHPKASRSLLLSSSELSSIDDSIALVNDLLLDVTMTNPFIFRMAKVDCITTGSNMAKIVVDGAKYATTGLGKFICKFISDDGKNIYNADSIIISDIDGSMTCSFTNNGFKILSKYSVGFESVTEGLINISSGSLDVTSSCFSKSQAPSFSPTQKPTTAKPTTSTPTTSIPTTANPTKLPTTAIPTKLPTTATPTKLPTTSSPSSSPTSSPSSTPTTALPTISPTYSPTRSPTNATESPVFILGGGNGVSTLSPTNQDDDVFGVIAIIGIAVGGFCFLLLLVLLLLLRKRRNNQRLRKLKEEELRKKKLEDDKGPIIIIGSNNGDISESSIDHQYNIGDRVEVKTINDGDDNNEEETWLKGTISGIEPDMNEIGKLRFTVTYDKCMGKSEPEKNLLSSQIRLMKTDYRVGDVVDALSSITGRWEKASITEVKPNDKYTVTFSSNSAQSSLSTARRSEEDLVGQTHIRPYNPKYDIGDVVEGDFNGKWKRGVVKNVIGSDLFDVSFDDDNDNVNNDGPVTSEMMERGELLTNEPKLIEMASENLRKLEFKAGDKIEILKGTAWIKGEVKKVQKNGRYEINVLPGTAQASNEGNVPIIRLRRQRSLISRSVGDVIEVHQPATNIWRRAHITECLGNDSYNVEYEDGKSSVIDTENNVPESRIRLPTYKIGDIVEAKTKDGWFAKGNWNRAKVIGVNKQDGTFDVSFMDDSLGTLKNLNQDQIRKARTDFNLGDQIEFFDKNTWNDGIIAKVLPDNNYLVRNSITKEEKIINGDLIRWPQYVIGDSVKVKVLMERKDKNGNNEWEPAELTDVNNDARTVDVKFEDCTTEENIPFSRIKKYASIGETNRAIEDAMNNGFRPPLRDHEGSNDPNAIDKSLRYQRRAPLSAKFLMGNKFAVTVNKEFGLGLTLGWTREGEVVVNNFKDLNNGDWGPLEACGLVGLRDQVIAINGQNVEGLAFGDIAEIIRASPNIISFVFSRASSDKLSVALQ